MSADLLQSQGEKSRKKSGKRLKGEKKVETEKIERKIWMALTGLRTILTLTIRKGTFLIECGGSITRYPKFGVPCQLFLRVFMGF